MQYPVPPPRRLPIIDHARSAALIGMVVFHLTFDLQMFALIAPGTIEHPAWMAFARLVAGSFVFLAGVSLVLAHGDGIRWESYVRGTGLVALAALAVSLATLVAMPQMFVFFGILHVIALGRVIGLGFLRAPLWLIAATLAVVWAAPLLGTHPAFNTRWLAWIGFARTLPTSMDFEPVFPWLAPFLLGMLAARLDLPRRASPLAQRGLLWSALAWAGRHSLPIYLIHQPVLIALVWTAARVMRG